MLRSVAIVATLCVVGCSTSQNVAGTEPTDAGVSDAQSARRDAEDDEGDDAATSWTSTGDDCPGVAPTKVDLDQPDGAPGWNPPRPPQPTACSVADLARLRDNVAAPSLARAVDLVQGLPTSCAQCLLSRATDATWQLIVDDGHDGFVDYGACYAVAPHGSVACGLAVGYLHQCADVSCNACPAAQLAYCTTAKATTSACDANFDPLITSSCDAANAQALDDACGTIVDAAAVLCGNGLPDGGSLGD